MKPADIMHDAQTAQLNTVEAGGNQRFMVPAASGRFSARE
jgi:hypothetical protein